VRKSLKSLLLVNGEATNSSPIRLTVDDDHQNQNEFPNLQLFMQDTCFTTIYRRPPRPRNQENDDDYYHRQPLVNGHIEQERPNPARTRNVNARSDGEGKCSEPSTRKTRSTTVYTYKILQFIYSILL
jgi:hypothetical protein